jgi:predicted RNA-binding Zn ribbon-like protein
MRQTIPTGQWFTSSEGHKWWFDSGAVSLDFAYTGAMGENPAWEELHAASDLATWLDGRFSAVDGTVTEGDLRDATALRAAIAQLAHAASAGHALPATAIDMVNLYAATPDIPPALPGGTRRAGRATARPAQALSFMAREAIDLFGEPELVRFRECAADDCQLIFYDESRSNNRRWCSMQRCGNRAKVRAHRSKTKENA